MKKPYILFCGDNERGNEIIEICKGKIKSSFITSKNAERIFSSSSFYPALICLIFSKSMYANDKLFKRIYEYSAHSLCPLHIDGSRRNIDTVTKLAPHANLQRSSKKLMLMTIDNLCEFAASNPDWEFELLKTRFKNVAVISDNASSLAFAENKASLSELKPRVIAVSGNCESNELDYLSDVSLSQIITDKPLNENSIKIFSRVSSSDVPAIILDRKERYYRKIKACYLDSRTEGNKITELLTEHSCKVSRQLYLKNK